MASPEAQRDFPEQDQRAAFCYSQWGDMTVNTNDRQSYAVTQRERTDQGYLKVPGRVARTGVQQYLAGELGLNDRAPNETVNVYRPPEEVFAEDSLQSYENADVTDGHPPEMVDAQTFKQYSRGNTLGPGRPEGEFVVVDMLIKDKAAIDAVEGGKVELSAGYRNEYHYEPGTAPDGTEYEFVQRGIRINHIALVDNARAGNEAKLFDQQPEGSPMSVVTLDGKSVNVDDESKAQLIQAAFDAKAKDMGEMEKELEDMKSKVKDMEKNMEEMKAAKDQAEEQAEEYKKESSDEALAQRLKTVSEVKDQAVKIAGEGFTSDSVDPVTIKREALKKARPHISWDEQTEDYVAAAWDLEANKPESERTQDAAARSHKQFSEDMQHLLTDDGKPAGTAAYQSFLQGGTA